MKTLSIRLPEELVLEIEELCKLELVDRDTILRKFIEGGLREYYIKKAFDIFQEGKISLWKAAKMAGLTYRGALEEMKKRNITFRYENKDLYSDIRWAMRER